MDLFVTKSLFQDFSGLFDIFYQVLHVKVKIEWLDCLQTLTEGIHELLLKILLLAFKVFQIGSKLVVKNSHSYRLHRVTCNVNYR